MDNVAFYAHAGTRENTRKSYQAAVKHFLDWGGLLPTNSEQIAQYLVSHAQSHAISTLRLRLAALAQWHINQGFFDPTKDTLVKKVFRGIQHEHPKQQKQAKPLLLDQLRIVDAWLCNKIEAALCTGNRGKELTYKRNRSLLLLCFWRGFRGDEITRLNVESVTAIAGEGMTCHLSKTKTSKNGDGAQFKVPALSRLCPVEAYLDWISSAHIESGPVYRGINRWGQIKETALHIDSLAPLIQNLLKDAGIEDSEEYSGHSLRRGFANWASSNGWDTRTLMEYVGWKSMASAMRYVDVVDPFSKGKIEQLLKNENSRNIKAN